MNHKLFWKLCAVISLVSVALVYLTAKASFYVEKKMSLINERHQQQITRYSEEAEALIRAGDELNIQLWLENLRKNEQTFAAIMRLESGFLFEKNPQDLPQLETRLGRRLDWDIHLYQENPLIQVPLTSDGLHFIFRLPDHMMPGRYWPHVQILLHFILPLLLMVLVSFLVYRHLMKPLAKLEKATRQFSEGNYESRVSPELNGRRDELGRLALTFDQMADRVGNLIHTQRHLINDLSHELRTPLQRIELCIETEKPHSYSRLKRETHLMRKLVEDTLTLAWLEVEKPAMRTEPVDLAGLLDAIVDDARFEYRDRELQLMVPEELLIQDSSEKALNIALENIIRNALRYTPASGTVSVTAELEQDRCVIRVVDQGPGIPEKYLQMIFKPFFRIDKSRERESGGFGLGLALAKRQIEGVSGSLEAFNAGSGGLCMAVTLPLSACQSDKVQP